MTYLDMYNSIQRPLNKYFEQKVLIYLLNCYKHYLRLEVYLLLYFSQLVWYISFTIGIKYMKILLTKVFCLILRMMMKLIYKSLNGSQFREIKVMFIIKRTHLYQFLIIPSAILFLSMYFNFFHINIIYKIIDI